MSKCGKGCMPECEYFTTGGCISPFNCMYKEESGYINSATSGTVIYTGGMNVTNEELKKKILSIVRGAMLEADGLPFIETTDNIADALIAAGIGDVKEAEIERKAYEVASNQYRIWFKEQRHRAERAERALQYAVSEYRCDECPCLDCTAEIRDSQECIDCICEEYKKQAEKDLAEEQKDEQA